jgi:ketosteroid isomerase-like protein
MSQENVDAVKAIWPHEVDVVELAQNPAVLPQFAAAISPETEVVFMTGALGVPNPTFQGIAGLVEGWRDWLEPYESYRLEVEDFIDAGGDRVVVPARVQARTRRDGVLVEHSPAAVCTISNGKLARVSFHLDRLQALEAVGLRE